MPSIEVTDEELQGFITLCATASGPGINWMLTNALLTKAREAQQRGQQTLTPPRPYSNSEDHDDAAVPRPS